MSASLISHIFSSPQSCYRGGGCDLGEGDAVLVPCFAGHRGGELEVGRDGGPDRAGAQPRWMFWGGLGASSGVWLPACFNTPSHLRAEGQSYLFLLAREPNGRPRFFFTESATWCLGGLAVPSGVVPGGGEVIPVEKKLWTRLRSPSWIWGPFYKSQGPVCNVLLV